MNWIYVIISFIVYFILYKYNIYSKIKFNNWEKKSNKKTIKNIRENWKEIKIKTDNCIVINYNTKIDKNSPIYSLTNENESFYEWSDRNPNRIDLVDLARSKVICDLIKDGEIKKQYSTTIDMDKTIVEFKLRMRDYICVYLSDEFEEENHFIDLEFLNEEIDINKFK
jgi:hypothetical protein